MKNKILKIAFVIFTITLCLATCMSVLALDTLSVSNSQDGIEATLNFNKEEYKKGDLIEVTLNIKNNNSYIVKDIQTELIVPDTLNLEKGSLTQENFSLNSGESKLQEVSFKVDSKTTDNEVVTINPKTKDNIVFYIIIMVVSITALAIIAISLKHFNQKGIKSIILCFMLIGSLTVCTLVNANVTTKEIGLEKNIKYDNEDILIKGIIKYSEVERFTIEVISNNNGTIIPSDKVILNSGQNQEFKIIPNTGYHIGKVEIDGIYSGVKDIYTFENVIENHKIEVTFEKNDDCEDPNCVSCPEKSTVCVECREDYELNPVGYCEYKKYTED